MYCEQCGSQSPDESVFCTACGAKNLSRQTYAYPVQVSNIPTAPKKRPRAKPMDYLLPAVAVLLILFGIGYMTLAAIGKTTEAHITSSQQVLFLNDDESSRNPSRYKLEYRFIAGETPYNGSVTRIFEGGSHIRQTITVRYLSFWPSINAEDSGLKPTGPVTLGVGILLLVLGIRQRKATKTGQLSCTKGKKQ